MIYGYKVHIINLLLDFVNNVQLFQELKKNTNSGRAPDLQHIKHLYARKKTKNNKKVDNYIPYKSDHGLKFRRNIIIKQK